MLIRNEKKAKIKRDVTGGREIDVLTTMTGVREYGSGYAVELVRNQATGRLVIRAFNEGRNNVTEVDLFDLLDWLNCGG